MSTSIVTVAARTLGYGLLNGVPTELVAYELAVNLPGDVLSAALQAKKEGFPAEILRHELEDGGTGQASA
jgi:hypothetical protein